MRNLLLLLVLALVGCKSPTKMGAAGTPTCRPELSVANWYVDPQNVTTFASDSNNCTTATTPCLTWNEIPAHRWQSNQPNLLCGLTSFTTGVIVNFLSGMSDTVADAITIDPPSGNLKFLGPLSAVNQVQTGTLASVIAKNPTSAQVLTATLGAGLVAGQLIVNSTHTSYAWTNTNTSGNVWMISQPMTQNAQAEVDTWANGDSYTVYNPIRLVVNLLGKNCITEFASLNLGPTNVGNESVRAVLMSESKINGELSSAGNESIFADNCDFPNTVLFSDPGGLAITGGQYRGTNNMQGLLSVTGDFLCSGLDLIPRAGSVLGKVWILGGIIIVEDVSMSNGGYIAGNTSISMVPGSTLSYTNTAASNFLNTTAPAGQFRLGGLTTPQTTACAVDTSVDPAVWHCGRSITAANLDATIASGGFAGNASVRACSIVKQ